MDIKKIVACFAISAVACGALVGCSASEESAESSTQDASSVAEESSEEAEEESVEEAAEESIEESSEEASSESDANYVFEIAGTSFSTDYNGDTVLIVEYNFTNNSEDSESFIFACQDTAFQNGIECDNSVIGCDDYDSQEQMNEIQPGTTYTVHIGYHVQDTTSPVDIEITDLLGLETFLEETLTF